MQLNHQPMLPDDVSDKPLCGADNQVRGKLGAAVLSLLGAMHGLALAQATDNATSVDGAVMHYKESGGRVSTTEAVVHAKETLNDGETLGLKLTFDTLSGGSPNGALPSKQVQTFARPSGKSLSTSAVVTPVQTYTTASGRVASSGGGSSTSGPYTVAPGALPLDTSFRDQRIAASLDWSLPIDSLTNLAVGGSFSHETDFLSLSTSATLSRDFNNKNTTLSAGVNLETDSIKPIGGAPVPLSTYSDFLKEGNKRKQVGDVLLGVSQVINRRWIMQLNWSTDKSSGYQNDPYKVVSALNADGSVKDYIYENRPDKRTRNSLYWGNKFALDHDTIDFSLRHMSDDWGIKSDTAEVRYRFAVSDSIYLEPQARYYKQSAADFFHFYLLDGAPYVPYASADPRLAKFHAQTFGLKFGMQLDKDSEISLRLQSYKQSGKGPDVSQLPQLQGLNLYPGLKAQLIEAGLKVSF